MAAHRNGKLRSTYDPEERLYYHPCRGAGFSHGDTIGAARTLTLTVRRNRRRLIMGALIIAVADHGRSPTGPSRIADRLIRPPASRAAPPRPAARPWVGAYPRRGQRSFRRPRSARRRVDPAARR